jgi:hypothetical protein
MDLYLLDAGGAFLIGYVLVIFLVITVILEWIILWLFKLNSPARLLLFSFVVNIVTLGLGYLLLPVIQQIGDDYSNFNQVMQWVIMLAITILAEGFLLQVLNKKSLQKTGKIWLAAIVMNLASYLVLYFFFVR